MKRILSTSIVIVLILSLIGCGQLNLDTWQGQFDLGIKLLDEGNYEEAILAFTKSIQIDPNHPEVYVYRGQAYISIDETGENLTLAYDDFNKAIMLDKNCVNAYLGLADVYIRRGEFEKAIEILKEGLSNIGKSKEIEEKIKEFESNEIKDSSGNVRKNINYNPDGTVASYEVYTYKNGRISECKVFNNDGTLSVTCIYEYNEQGQRTKVSQYDNTGILMDYWIYKHDSKGRETSGHCYDENGKLLRYSNSEYNDTEKTEKVSQYSADGTLQEYVIRGEGWWGRYDSIGKLIEGTEVP